MRRKEKRNPEVAFLQGFVLMCNLEVA